VGPDFLDPLTKEVNETLLGLKVESAFLATTISESHSQAVISGRRLKKAQTVSSISFTHVQICNMSTSERQLAGRLPV
jgi:hypothetical protein